jgi:peptide/nickel transport system substrate-binding protein
MLRDKAAAAALAAAIAVAAGAALASGCSAKARRTPDDTLVVLIPNLIRNLDPRFALTSWDTNVSRIVAPGLMTIDQPSLEPMPALAESIDRIDDVTWEVVLRDDARFSDGSPVRAEDVAYTIESTMDPDTGSLFRQGFTDRFASVEVTGPLTVRLHLVDPIATLFSDLDFGVISKQAAEAHGGRFPDGRVVGAGPYRIVSRSTERVLLERNPHYHGDPGGMERIEIRTVRDANARTLMLVGGSGDLTQNSVRMDLVSDVEARQRLDVQTSPGAILTYMMMNNEHPVLSDVRVRRAIAHAVDRERIVDAKFDGRAVLATGLLPEAHWAYHGDVDRYDYDPARAEALLDEAGFPDPGGGRPRLSLSYRTSADPFRLAIARIIAAQLGDVGIEVDVRAFEFGTFLADIKEGSYELAAMATSPITEPDWTYAYFHSSRVPDEEDPDSLNRWRYRSERLDELTEAGRREMERERRIEIYREVQEVLARDVPIVPLWHADNVVVHNTDVAGYELFTSARLHGLAKAVKSQ